MGAINLYFTGHNDLMGWFIGLGTGGFPYHHVGAIANGYPFQKGDLISAHWSDGLKVRVDADEGGWAHWANVRIPVPDDVERKFYRWLKDHAGEKYAKGVIFDMVWTTLTACGVPSRWPSQWVCSSSIEQALVAAGEYPAIKPISINLYTPRDVFVSSIAKVGATWSKRPVGAPLVV